jgi:hypothetical protein
MYSVTKEVTGRLEMDKRTIGGVLVLVIGGIMLYNGFMSIIFGFTVYLEIDVVSAQYFIFGSVYMVTACVSFIGGVQVFSDKENGGKLALGGTIGLLVGGIIWSVIIIISLIPLPYPSYGVVFQSIVIVVVDLSLQGLLLYGAILCFRNR